MTAAGSDPSASTSVGVHATTVTVTVSVWAVAGAREDGLARCVSTVSASNTVHLIMTCGDVTLRTCTLGQRIGQPRPAGWSWLDSRGGQCGPYQ